MGWIVFLLLSPLIFSACATHPVRQEPVYSTDWFSTNIDTWETHLSGLAGKPNISYLEIGVFEGRSAIWVLDNILTHPTARATWVDPLFDGYEQTLLRNLSGHPHRRKVSLRKGFSTEVLRTLKFDSFDLIYVDGNHSAKDVFVDAALLWDLLKVGGILIFDDYKWKEHELPLDWRPQLAIDTFLTAFGEDLELLHKGYQVIVQKKERLSQRNRYNRIGNCIFFWHPPKLVLRDRDLDISESESSVLQIQLRKKAYGSTRIPEDITRRKLTTVANRCYN